MDISREDRDRAEEIFKAMGGPSEGAEKCMDAITGLRGSAPAYLAIVV